MQEVGNLESVSHCAHAASAARNKGTTDQHAAAYGSSSDKLKDALRVSFTDWLSESFSAGGGNKTSVSSKNKSLADRSQEVISAKMVDGMAQQITANSAVSRLAQANVTQDVALYLLSVGALTEAVPEPEQKQLTLFETDEMGMRIKTRVPPRPF